MVASGSNRAMSVQHIDTLLHETVNWELIETHWQDVMQVLISIQQGKISTDWLLRKLSSESRCSRIYITATTNKVEAFHQFSQWLFFGGDGVLLTSPDSEEQEKAMLYQGMVANAVIDQNVVDMNRNFNLIAGDDR